MANQEQQRSDNQEEAVEQQQQASEAEPAAAEERAAEEGESVEALQAQVADLTEQIATAKDQALRAQAEIQNVRRRAERDVESAHKFALEKFAKELLPVVDSLERAVETPPQEGEDTAMREGVEMTLKLFVDTLAKFNLEPIDPLGEPFDPQYHEAMSMVEQPDAEPNSVIAVMQKGYTLNGRLVRPAMVVVAKGGSTGVDAKA